MSEVAQMSITEQFAFRLEQSYEHIHLLYGLANSLRLKDPADFVLNQVCKQLRTATQLGWVAIAVHGFPPHWVGKEARDGDMPDSFDWPGSFELLERDWESDSPKVLTPETHRLAALVNDEIIVNPIHADGMTVGFLVAGAKSGPDPGMSSYETQPLTAAASFVGLYCEDLARLKRNEELFWGSLQALTSAIDAKDPYTRGHSQRVALLAEMLAAQLGMPNELQEQYRIAGLVHDVGKMGVAEAVLLKPGKLTDEEFDALKKHPEIGYRILNTIEPLIDVLPGVLHHHERWDGRGYPHKLAGEDIPYIARCLAFCDTFDAMSSNRSYRSAIPREGVLEEIRRCSGTQFDPSIVEPFLSMDFARFDELLGNHRGSIAA